MFKMYIKIDSNRLSADGVGSKIAELNSAINEISSYKIENISKDKNGNMEQSLSTTNFGDESYLISLLEEMPWFMKYVLVWNVNDNGLESNMIDVEREMGLQCSYASW